MRTLYLILLIVAAVCFALATVLTPAVGNPRRPFSLIAAGLLFWVLVPLIQTADRLGE